ncbi:MAG: hypothetical protein WCQ90_07630, partial [Deltaproteobacteria bacterium]
MNNVKKIFCSGLLFLLFFAMPLYVFGQYRATAPRIQQAPAPKVQPAPKIHVSPQRSQVWNDAMKALEKGDMAAYNKLNQQYIQMGKEQTAGPPAPAAPAPGIHAPPAVPSAAAVSPIMPSWGMPMPVSPAPASHGTT